MTLPDTLTIDETMERRQTANPRPRKAVHVHLAKAPIATQTRRPADVSRPAGL